MKMSKVGNQTNSQDPQAVNSRVFVGNLNTFQCSKTDVERMFQRYGRLAGISMHKGYAFVQFTNPFDARNACLGEDGRTVLGQILDVNMVAEPKPHQTGRKRQNVAKTGNDWDYYYDSYYAQAATFATPRLVPPLKRPRLMTTHATVPAPVRVVKTANIKTSSSTTSLSPAPSVGQLKTYSNPDILICGNCREMFAELQELLDHKKTYCKLRFTCKCNIINGTVIKNQQGDDIVSLMCVQCKDSFPSAWDLMVHVQAAHMLNIYELGVSGKGGNQDSQVRISSEDRLSPSPSNNHKDATDDGERDMMTSPTDTEEELIQVESTAQSCIMHALHVENAGESGIGNGDETINVKPLTNGELKAQE
ncbi:RNA-binding protein Raly isoform X2 [Lycorma delicatula]